VGRLKKDEKGAIGIEILIVFIAIVLVAAVSAAVLIQTVGYLQQKATSTGRTTTQEVSSGIRVVKIMGHTTGVGGYVDKLAIYVEPNTGGQDIDLSQLTITISEGTKQVVLTYNSTYYNESYPYDDVFGVTVTVGNTSSSIFPQAYEFGIIVLQDVDGSMSATNPVMNTGDKVILAVNTSYIFNGIEERTDVTGEVRPEFGAPGIIEFTTPPAYTESVVELQ